MQYLIGMIITMAAFIILIFVVNRISKNEMPKDLRDVWKISNEQSKIKNALLERIATVMEKKMIGETVEGPRETEAGQAEESAEAREDHDSRALNP